MSTPDNEKLPSLPAPSPWRGWSFFFILGAATFFFGLMVSSVTERRQEAKLPPQVLTPIKAYEGDSAVWGVNFPREYESWKRTAAGSTPTKYGGPVKFSHLQRDPMLKQLFAGYPFSVEYDEDRGHMHAIEDVMATARRDPKRGGKPQPGTCMTCKSSDVPGLMQKMGTGKFYQAHFEDIAARVNKSHPIGCADCHDPKTMELHISRPALREAFNAMGRDVDQASHQEMRSLVCAQCHVEYYFAKQPGDTKKGTYLTFPWKEGLTVDDMDTYYTKDVRQVDWVHPVSKTEMVKMQHPDYETYSQGIHAYRGVACADCHMPYRSEGGVKYTEHDIQSPLKNISNSCAVCHRWSEAEVKARVESIQDTTHELLQDAEQALVAAHAEVGKAAAAGATDADLKAARELLRRAQLRWDYVAAGNGMGFHAPQECARVLATAINLAQQARLEVAKLR